MHATCCIERDAGKFMTAPTQQLRCAPTKKLFVERDLPQVISKFTPYVVGPRITWIAYSHTPMCHCYKSRNLVYIMDVLKHSFCTANSAKELLCRKFWWKGTEMCRILSYNVIKRSIRNGLLHNSNLCNKPKLHTHTVCARAQCEGKDWFIPLSKVLVVYESEVGILRTSDHLQRASTWRL